MLHEARRSFGEGKKEKMKKQTQQIGCMCVLNRKSDIWLSYSDISCVCIAPFFCAIDRLVKNNITTLNEPSLTIRVMLNVCFMLSTFRLLKVQIKKD